MRKRRPQPATSSRPKEPASAPKEAGSAPPPLDGTGGFPAGLPLYTVRQLAGALQVSRSTIRRMTTMGQIPHMRVAGQIRFDIIAVKARLDRSS